MMMQDIEQLVTEYSVWLRDKTALRQVGEWIEITTPYLDRHNDYMQIYAKSDNGGYLLTDGGDTVSDLKNSGCNLDNKKRQDLLAMTLNGFGVQLSSDMITTHASPHNFALKKHNLVQAMLAVNDLFYLAAPVVQSLFLEDVAAWLDLYEIRYTPNVKFSGQGGLDHVFDFVIPKSISKHQPERIIKAINRPSRETTQALVFAWIDTREARPADSRAYAMLNDSDHTPQSSFTDTLKSYEVMPILWSRRETVREELAA